MSALEAAIFLLGLFLIVLGIMVSAVILWRLGREYPELPSYLVERSRRNTPNPNNAEETA